MKKFENPAIEVIAIAVEDIITTSGGVACPNRLEEDEM